MTLRLSRAGAAESGDGSREDACKTDCLIEARALGARWWRLWRSVDAFRACAVPVSACAKSEGLLLFVAGVLGTHLGDCRIGLGLVGCGLWECGSVMEQRLADKV